MTSAQISFGGYDHVVVLRHRPEGLLHRLEGRGMFEHLGIRNAHAGQTKHRGVRFLAQLAHLRLQHFQFKSLTRAMRPQSLAEQGRLPAGSSTTRPEIVTTDLPDKSRKPACRIVFGAETSWAFVQERHRVLQL